MHRFNVTAIINLLYANAYQCIYTAQCHSVVDLGVRSKEAVALSLLSRKVKEFMHMY